MASIQDVADQINAKLDAITNSTSTTATNTAATLDVVRDIRDLADSVNDRLTAVHSELESGFANLSQGLFAQLEVQRASLRELDHHRRQNDTIICELVNGNDLLCGITRKLTQQLALSEVLVTTTSRLEGVSVRIHAEAAGDYDRSLALARSIEACCPPPPVEPEECPPACDKPDFRPTRPEGQKWEPLPTPDRPDRPIG